MITFRKFVHLFSKKTFFYLFFQKLLSYNQVTFNIKRLLSFLINFVFFQSIIKNITLIPYQVHFKLFIFCHSNTSIIQIKKFIILFFFLLF
jgi:hypothetical protein